MPAVAVSEQSSSRNFPIIGVRDSGVGGLTVAREIKRAVPHARLLYFADTAHVPYGGRSAAEVRFFALSISEFLLGQGAEFLVFACNTTSAYALPSARQRFAQPVFGMIEPGVQVALAATKNGRIGVLATAATVASGVYSQELQRNPGIQSFEIGCPAFVPLVESGRTQSPEALDAATEYLRPLLKAEVDTVVLGCTHFPLLLPILREVAPQLHFVDPARAVAAEIAEKLARLPLSAAPSSAPSYDTIFVSGESKGVRHWVQQLLPNSAARFECGPVFEPAGVV